jgi:MFS family permease
MVAATALLLVGSANGLRGSDGQPLLNHDQIGLLVAPLVFVLGFMNAVVSVAAQTILQENTTDTNRGKVFGALGMMINIAATLPIFFAGILADLFGVAAVVTTLGASLLLFAVGQYLQLRREHKLDA